MILRPDMNSMSSSKLDAELADYAATARAWLDGVAARRDAAGEEGSDSVALFPEWDAVEPAALLADARRWLRQRFEAGYSGIALPREVGGQGLTHEHERVYETLEADYVTPPSEIWNLGHHMVIPAIARFGTDAQRERFVLPGLRGDELFCQLFSEPNAGSDLASLRTRAERDGDRWIVNGQKVWTSAAHVADHGMLLCRTDPDASKHRGITCFIVPLDAPGVTVRPIRQITGGSAFNEVFLDEVEVADDLRVGELGGGWGITRATLEAERLSVPLNGPHGSPARLIALAQRLGRAEDAAIRQRLADLAIRRTIADLTLERAHAAARSGAGVGALASVLKLQTTELLTAMGATAGEILGSRLVADTGEWGTWAWHRHVLESAGLRIGGGTDEIQRNVIAEAALGLPREPSHAIIEPTGTPRQGGRP